MLCVGKENREHQGIDRKLTGYAVVKDCVDEKSCVDLVK
jgi:hypothetical protein